MTQVISNHPATGVSRHLDVAESSPADVAGLTERAANAGAELSARSHTWRAELLHAMADELEADGAGLVDTAMEETALPRARLEAELRRTAFQLRFFAGVVSDGRFLDASIDHATDSPMGPLPDLRRYRIPLGPVAVFGSSNFPFAFSVPGGDTASALAAGCPVVIKAHPAHPATSERAFAALQRGAERADAPPGTVGLVFGIDAGLALVSAPGIAAVGFTGSLGGGRFLAARAAERPVPIPFYGELGSANPLVVSTLAARERADEIAAGLAGSVTLGVGQFCTKPGLLFIPAGPDGDQLVGSLAAALTSAPPATMLSTGIAAAYGAGLGRLAAGSGATVLVNGTTDGTLASPELLTVSASDFAAGDSALHEECFGPVAVVVRYRDRPELAAALARTAPSLTFSLFVAVDDPDGPWIAEIGTRHAGRVIANGYPTGVGVSWSMQHGGPWPATTNPSATSVGAAAIDRWLRPVTFQNFPESLLPVELRDHNPVGLPQRVDGRYNAR